MTGAVLDKAAGVDISFTDNKNRGGARYRAALGFLMGVERTRQMMKIGFIGTGNMGGALASAAARSGNISVFFILQEVDFKRSAGGGLSLRPPDRVKVFV